MKFNFVKQTLAGLALSLTVAGFAVPSYAAQASGTYVTAKDDTFWKISQKLRIPLDDLLQANTNIHPLNVYEGLTMVLPTAGVPVAQKQAADKVAATEAQPAAAQAVKQNSVKTASGETLSYSKIIQAVATAYSDAPEENGYIWGPVDYFGNPLKLGTVAVDPKMIPLGTKLYITGYTSDGLPSGLVATATDIGGAIRENRVDIFVPGPKANAMKFGIQNVQIYVLK
ncbi:3D domain-containing protein [Paenibacillus eucommiae]|uniref:3D (Asp-Asp-Asp) domain-containing protein n=1 Tax=Paenibacillus eucommiae TaxID=1355755 RepID=A0ABS4J2Q1_9BACL|nr:3D domain-containing protein [Paenibacillus eucommiae]MBP1993089.1 3D (Asp-Asp-Asp) domain-containing protein [Paenibacillus eucommiae]